MSYIAKSAIKHNGTRYVRGDELPELTEEQVEALLFAGAVEQPEELNTEPQGDLYTDLKVAELREELEKRGLPTSGTKAELIERLKEDDASEPSDEEEDQEGDEEDGDDSEEEDDTEKE